MTDNTATSQNSPQPNAASDGSKVVFDTLQIQELLPHRPPFLLIDKIIEFIDNDRVVAIKSVTINETFFQGHFPNRPIMPGVLILEAMAQAGGILALASSEGSPKGTYLFIVGADQVKWKRPVVPGDQMRIEMIFRKRKKPLWFLDGTVTVDGALVASANIIAADAK